MMDKVEVDRVLVEEEMEVAVEVEDSGQKTMEVSTGFPKIFRLSLRMIAVLVL